MRLMYEVVVNEVLTDYIEALNYTEENGIATFFTEDGPVAIFIGFQSIRELGPIHPHAQA